MTASIVKTKTNNTILISNYDSIEEIAKKLLELLYEHKCTQLIKELEELL